MAGLLRARLFLVAFLPRDNPPPPPRRQYLVSGIYLPRIFRCSSVVPLVRCCVGGQRLRACVMSGSAGGVLLGTGSGTLRPQAPPPGHGPVAPLATHIGLWEAQLQSLEQQNLVSALTQKAQCLGPAFRSQIIFPPSSPTYVEYLPLHLG